MALSAKSDFDRLPHNRRFSVLYEHGHAVEQAPQETTARVETLERRLEAIEKERSGPR
jgi:polyhydroxyalkanoate synthesis regulator phasin